MMRIVKYIASAAFFLLLSPVMNAQKTMTASGTYVYYPPANMSLEQAENVALDRAKAQIIADNFGTVIGVTYSTVMSNSSEGSSVSYLSIGESEVKGEWLETKGKPKVDISYERDMLMIKVSITGVIREIATARVDFDAKILRNGISDKFESEEFRDDDDLFVSFKSPRSGYLVIYLFDKDGVYRLLPVKGQEDGSVAVKADERYVFFEQPVSNSLYPVREGGGEVRSIYAITCNSDAEFNRIYMVFSPNRFTRPVDTVTDDSLTPAYLSFEAFQKWLSKARKLDEDMGVVIKDIIIRK